MNAIYIALPFVQFALSLFLANLVVASVERYTRGGGIQWKYEFASEPRLQHLGVGLVPEDVQTHQRAAEGD